MYITLSLAPQKSIEPAIFANNTQPFGFSIPRSSKNFVLLDHTLVLAWYLLSFRSFLVLITGTYYIEINLHRRNFHCFLVD